MKIIDTDKYRFIISIVSYFIFNKNKDQTRDAPYCDHINIGQYVLCFNTIRVVFFPLMLTLIFFMSYFNSVNSSCLLHIATF